MKLSFKAPDWDEKRQIKRAPVEMPVEVRLRGSMGKEQIRGSIHHASQSGMRVESFRQLPAGERVSLVAYTDGLLPLRKTCRLKASVVWSEPKNGFRMFHAGLALDGKCKDMKHWRQLIVDHLRDQENV